MENGLEEHKCEAREFDKMICENGIIFCWNFEPIDAHNCEVRKIICPPGVHFMEYETRFKKYYEKEFDSVGFIKGLS